MGLFKNLPILISTILFSFLVLFFQNCSNSTTDSSKGSHQANAWLTETPPAGLNQVNYFVGEKPSDMSGYAGYVFLYKQYFQPKCAVCHMQPSGTHPQFGTTINLKSYQVALQEFDTKETLRRVTHNDRCPECTLDPRSEVFQAINYWLSHRE